MEEQLISFETDKLAKEKVFDWYVLNHYNNKTLKDKVFIFQDDLKNSELEFFEYSAPTQSLLQKWLREVHDIHINIIYPNSVDDYINSPLFRIEILEKIPQSLYKRYRTGWAFNFYEEALEHGLQEALKLINEE